MAALLRTLHSRCLTSVRRQCRSLSLTLPLTGKYMKLSPRKPLDPDSYTVTFLKGSGPGGQKINKTSSAVQLKHLPSGHVIKCQDTRSQSQNLKRAIRKLQDLLDLEENGAESRTALKREWRARTKANKAKKARRKYEKLERTEARKEERESKRERLMKAILKSKAQAAGLTDGQEEVERRNELEGHENELEEYENELEEHENEVEEHENEVEDDALDKPEDARAPPAEPKGEAINPKPSTAPKTKGKAER